MGPRDLLDRRRHHHLDRHARTPTIWPWRRATSRSRRSTWTSRTTRCSKRSRDGRWRGRGGRRLRRLSQPAGRDPAGARASATSPCCAPSARCRGTCSCPRACATARTRTSALPIGGGQTISQPWVQARYLELAALTGRERVLEIGAGSGYQTALLALLADAVFAVERIPALAQSARGALEAAGIRNVTVLVGDGTLGWRPFAPYDAILVAAASPEIPAPLVEQLAPGGRLIIPLGDRDTPGADPRPARRAMSSQHQHRRRRPLRAAPRPVRLLLMSAWMLTSFFQWLRRRPCSPSAIRASSCSWPSNRRCCRCRASWSCRPRGTSRPRAT